MITLKWLRCILVFHFRFSHRSYCLTVKCLRAVPQKSLSLCSCNCLMFYPSLSAVFADIYRLVSSIGLCSLFSLGLNLVGKVFQPTRVGLPLLARLNQNVSLNPCAFPSEAKGIYSNLEHMQGNFLDQACLVFASAKVYDALLASFTFISWLCEENEFAATGSQTQFRERSCWMLIWPPPPPGAIRRKRTPFGVRDSGV